LLRQLLSNLVDNAIKHGPPENRVEIGISVACEASILLRIADRGPGIQAADRDAVQQPFFRLERSRPITGAGLGLATVKAIADLHDAELALADNAPGLVVSVLFHRRGA
jgi:signal transduction histidine kinase